ncbi:hypothetical protein KUCAC02_000240 [Chaenocephalus aceratus]|uniref:Uncharacterized protein n=1 Tax=Chaenocephalus aceratus TaxID=36190 RepID=A0ACB9W5S1_CHAAC|nr:hypothetical protein KUCAC02_000240 [Chaenocephalus aceratus]
MFVAAREQLRRSRHSRTFLVESGTGELWSELQDWRGNGLRRRAEPTPSTSPCPSLSSTSKEDNKGRVWRPPEEEQVSGDWEKGVVGCCGARREAMNELFQTTISNIVKHIEELVAKHELQGVRFLFLVGGFAESPMLQKAVQRAVGRTGPCSLGLDPTVVRVRRCPLIYGVGVLNRFVEGRHPRDKLLIKDGREWCTDILDRFVCVDQSVALGEVVKRSYTPARLGQRKIIINIYCSPSEDVIYISDPGVRNLETRRSKSQRLTSCLNRSVRASIDFLAN